jgi:hypothetical protein
MRNVAAVAWLLVALLAGGCVYPATEVIVRIDTDVPADRTLLVTVTVHGANASGPGAVRTWLRTDATRANVPGVDAGVAMFPASFAIVPGPGPRDGQVGLVVDAVLAARTPSEAPVSFRRVARFHFTPGETTVLPIFLSSTCATPTTGCTQHSGADCTISSRCEEMGRTCGDRGDCIAPATDPHPITPGDIDAGILGGDGGPRDAARPDGRLDASADSPSDPCGCGSRAHATTSCVAAMCLLSCDRGFGNCDGDDANGCEAALDAPEHCGTCGNTCPAGQLCTSGSCVPNCSGGTVLCGARCVDLQTSSTNCGACGNACASGTACMGGTCLPICTGTTSLCGSQCVDLQVSTDHCGACGTVCPRRANGSPACRAGVCGVACNAGFGDCDGDVSNGCETDVTSSTSHCGACGASCDPANASGVGSGGNCAIGGCASGWVDVDGNVGNGCECAVDSNGSSCVGTTPVGPIAVGGSTTLSGNLVPAGASDWFAVSFVAGGHPHVTLTRNPGGHFLRLVGTCGGPVACGGPVTDWDFYDTTDQTHSTRNVPAPTLMIVEVASTGGPTCGQYAVSVSN